MVASLTFVGINRYMLFCIALNSFIAKSSASRTSLSSCFISSIPPTRESEPRQAETKIIPKKANNNAMFSAVRASLRHMIQCYDVTATNLRPAIRAGSRWGVGCQLQEVLAKIWPLLQFLAKLDECSFAHAQKVFGSVRTLRFSLRWLKTIFSTFQDFFLCVITTTNQLVLQSQNNCMFIKVYKSSTSTFLFVSVT